MILEALHLAIKELQPSTMSNPKSARNYIEIAGLILPTPPAISPPYAVLSPPQSLFALYMAIFDDLSLGTPRGLSYSNFRS